ncbi:hypothetical protein Tco_0520527 [Tanacetum coccineum]
MEEFATNDKENYYSGNTSIMVNGKRAYELKGKFLDDLRDNSFSRTNGEDAVEHIKYFFKIVDPINLPKVNYERLRLSVFPISLVGNASKWFDESKSNDHEGVADKEFSDAEKANNDDEQETVEIFRIETNLFDYETLLNKTYEDYENELNDELEEPWSEDGVPYEICDHICEPFRFKNGKAKWPTCNSNEDEFCNGGELPGMVRVFRKFPPTDYELLIKLQDYWWKVNDHECSPFSNWRNHIKGPYANYYSNFLDNENNDKHGLFDNQKRSVCKTRRFKIIKYSFGKDEEYVAIKEHEYDDLTSTSEEACQEIFHRMDEA